MKEEILLLLKNTEGFISGEEISKKFGVTRASIWKIINQLKEQGYAIESSTRKGYRLLTTPDVITKEELKSIINTKVIGKHIEYYDEVDSTNNEAKKLARNGAEDGTLVIANCQTKGKGRLGRSWLSPKDTGIWMSAILTPNIMPSQVSCMTLIAGLDMCKAIKKITGLNASIKWPNDIIIGSKKVCGILTEMSAEMQRINYIVVGIGVNVNTAGFDKSISHATSLMIEGQKKYERRMIIKEFVEKFDRSYTLYNKECSFAPFLDIYKENCMTLNKEVKIITNGDEYIAYAKDILADGSLLVETKTKEEKVIVAGEVSVRGIQGYI